MRYYGIIKDDVSAGEGFCVTFFVQGCPHHCPGCHNPDSWSFTGGKEFTTDTLNEILDSISLHVTHNFCVMGGEPLCPENLFLTLLVVQAVHEKYPFIKIYIWTGYTYDELQNIHNNKLTQILELTDYLIDGRFIQEERDITLPMRGSKNQKIINLQELRANNESI